MGDYDTDAKMNPPLRTERDLQAMLKGMADGTIDAIATDHAPHHCDEKCVEFSGRAVRRHRTGDRRAGLPRSAGAHRARSRSGGWSSCSRPGRRGILRLDKGTLRPGADADITVLDLDRRTTIEPEAFRSKSSNTPFRGWELRGAPVMTIVGGRDRSRRTLGRRRHERAAGGSIMSTNSSNAVFETELPGVPLKARGKVRDIYDLGDRAADRGDGPAVRVRLRAAQPDPGQGQGAEPDLVVLVRAFRRDWSRIT